MSIESMAHVGRGMWRSSPNFLTVVCGTVHTTAMHMLDVLLICIVPPARISIWRC